MLFACSYYTLMLKEAEDKIYHTCFSEILFFFFLSFFFFFNFIFQEQEEQKTYSN